MDYYSVWFKGWGYNRWTTSFYKREDPLYATYYEHQQDKSNPFKFSFAEATNWANDLLAISCKPRGLFCSGCYGQGCFEVGPIHDSSVAATTSTAKVFTPKVYKYECPCGLIKCDYHNVIQ